MMRIGKDSEASWFHRPFTYKDETAA
jgi:hypothetical protein